MSNETERTDVAIIGAGPAGLAAGLFTARYGLRTRIFDRGPSLLMQCAYLDNYLGFPAGIEAADFLQLGKEHALEAGCVITQQRVTGVNRANETFVLRTRRETFAAERIVVACGYDCDFLRELAIDGLFDVRGELCADQHGRTCCEGLYVAGPLAGVEDQALICAGHGARVALGLIRDLRSARLPWQPLARHLDWQVREGVYDSERYAVRVHAYFKDECKPTEEREAEFRARVDDWICDKRKQQIARVELARRRLRAARLCAAAAEPASRGPSETP
jgi:NADPH-dependent 2,4-dienoyl-CoA reductase/sulfur reductase-like enzyme